MIEEEEIVRIIQKKFVEELTANEADRLNKWLAVPANKEIYKQYYELWNSVDILAHKQDSFTPNSPQSWETIKGQIVADKTESKFKIGYAVAATVALIFMLLGANYIFNSSKAPANIQVVLQSNENDTLTFSDGSQAYLFGPCSISYPEQFASHERIISMNGFVYFDIARDKSRPFEINTENGNVNVLGTSFTVNTRQKDLFVVECITGKVKVTAVDNTNKFEVVLTKNLKASYKAHSNLIDVTPFEMDDLSIEIPARNIVFSNKPLGEILNRIESSFDVTIQLENKELLETKYSTTLNDSTLDDFLNELKVTFNLEVIQTQPSTYILKKGELN